MNLRITLRNGTVIEQSGTNITKFEEWLENISGEPWLKLKDKNNDWLAIRRSEVVAIELSSKIKIRDI